MADFLIRLATSCDIPTIAAIYGRSVLTGTASFELEAPDETEMARRMTVLLDAGYPYFVAEDQIGVLGYAYAGPYRPRPGYRNTVEDSVYIAERARRRGVGEALLKQVVTECEMLGFREMIAVIGDSAHIASIRLHEKQGFVVAGRLAAVGYKFGRWLDTVLMQRPLGPGANQPPTR